MSSFVSAVPRLARYAGVVLNALTALTWGGIAVTELVGKVPLYAVLSLVLVAMYTLTGWGFLQRNPAAYARSFRVHTLGLLFDVAELVIGHAFLYAPLAVLHGLALLCTWLARVEFAPGVRI